jgi:hypothetical protein
MKRAHVVLASCALACAAFAADEARVPGSPPSEGIAYVPGSSQKVCQPLGETDYQTRKPTVSRTATRYGLVAADLGYSFEHNGKLVFLFGDSVPTPTFNGKPNQTNDPPRTKDDNDVIGFSSDTNIEQCLKMDFYRNAIGAFKNPVVLDPQGRPAIRLATNEMPIAGISAGGKAYVLFGTDNYLPTPDPANNLLGYSTRTVMAVSDDDASTFHFLYDFSSGSDAKFVNVAIARAPDGYLYFWGTQGGRLYRHSAVYFARKPAQHMDRAGEMDYFAGLGAGGAPRFAPSETAAVPIFADDAEGGAEPRACAGELGVEWNRFVNRWMMLYNCANRTPANLPGIYMRLAEHAWGPWSAPQTVFNAERDGGLCHFMHRAVTAANPACDDLSPPRRLAVQGGAYGPYFISRFTTGDEARATSTFYYTMATWNPYGQVIMKSTIRGAH